MKDSRLRENIIALAVLQALNYVAPLITVPYLLRVLGPSHYGLVAFAQALVAYFDAFTSYGFNLSATRAVAYCRDRQSALAATFWRTVYARAVLMLASAAMLAVLVACVPRLRATPWLYGAAFETVIGTTVFPVWFFQGLEQMRFITLAQACARAVSIAALLLFVRHSGDYLAAAVIQGGVPVLAAMLAVPAIRRCLRRGTPRPQLVPIWETLRDGRHTFAVQIGLELSTSTATVVLGFLTGSVAVGYYSAADKVIRAVSSLLSPAAQALYPYFSNLRELSTELALRAIRKSFGWIAALALVASSATFLLAAPVGPLIWGPGFTQSIAVLRLLSPLPFLFSLINVFGTQTLLVFGMDALVGRIALGGAGVNLLLAAALSLRFGAPGAAAATVITAVLLSLSLAWSVRRVAAGWRTPVPESCAP